MRLLLGKLNKWQICVIAFAVIFVLLRPVHLVIVRGRSMHPTYTSNQAVLATDLGVRLKRNDVVVARVPGYGTVIKRIGFVPGDRYYEVVWQAGKDDEVGQVSRFLPPEDTIVQVIQRTGDWRKIPSLALFREHIVPPDEYILLGDNYANSTDSRFFGTVSRKHIQSVVIFPKRDNASS